MSDKKKKKRTVKKNYVKDAKSKKVVKTNKRGTTTTKEKVSQYNKGYLGHEPADIPYGNKNIWEKTFKSKVNKEGKETKRKEKIVYDDGNQMKIRKQRVIRFGPNKGKIKSVTKTYKRGGGRSRTVNYLDQTNKEKL
tara:strand:+ start:1595 stop:2005 length:411 start_codon:yes stop_codon:yes gene_type:complete